MKYNYLVKHNGIYYKAGEEVPDNDTDMPNKNKEVELKKEVVEEQKFDVSTLEVQETNISDDKDSYSKTDIMKMSKSALIDEFKKNNIEYNEELSNAEMKKTLLAFYGL